MKKYFGGEFRRIEMGIKYVYSKGSGGLIGLGSGGLIGLVIL